MVRWSSSSQPLEFCNASPMGHLPFHPSGTLLKLIHTLLGGLMWFDVLGLGGPFKKVWSTKGLLAFAFSGRFSRWKLSLGVATGARRRREKAARPAREGEGVRLKKR